MEVPMPTADQMREALKEVYDPEIPINIVDLGLLYSIQQPAPGEVLVEFSLTNPMCPIGDQLAEQIKAVIGRQEGVVKVDTKLVWEPLWSKEKMTEDGKLQASMLGFA
jgi:metal-sulfur cluster biosynthetic enzyme